MTEVIRFVRSELALSSGRRECRETIAAAIYACCLVQVLAWLAFVADTLVHGGM